MQIASSENLTFRKHFDFKKARTKEYPGAAKPPNEDPEDKPECSFHLQCLQILTALMLTVCDSSLLSFLKADLQSREAIANCLRSQIKEQIV